MTRTAVFAYLKVYGLNQYARAFLEASLPDLEAIGRLSETEALEFLEKLRVYPGHRLRLLRAIDCLRNAALGAERRDAAQMLEDDAALDRLCNQNEELSKEKHKSEDEVKRLQEDNARLLGALQQQDKKSKQSQDRIQELEDLVQAQTEQVSFLAQQLQIVAEADPKRENELYKSYRESFDDKHDDDWNEAQRIQLPEDTVLPGANKDAEAGKAAFSLADFSPAQPPQQPGSAPAAQPNRGSRTGLADSPQLGRSSRTRPPAPFSPPRRAKMAQSLDSAQVRECLAGFDVDHIIRCLASALQNCIIMCVAKSRPHAASVASVAACVIFMEPACRERIEQMAAQTRAQAQASSHRSSHDGASPLSSLCSPLMTAAGASVDLRDSMGKPVDPLNALAVRSVPNKWDIYGFLRDVMVNFRLEPEVSVITLFYLERFTELSGIALTPDNWQRLTITSMMLASKVWNDESFENIEFSQLCPLYTLDEINAFERIFLKHVSYNMSVKGSEYAKTYFLLRTLGAKDAADFGLEPMDGLRASRLAERCLEKQLEFRERYPDDGGASAMNWTL